MNAVIILAINLFRQNLAAFGNGCHWRVNPKTLEIQVLPTNIENPSWMPPVIPYPYVTSFEEWKKRLERQQQRVLPDVYMDSEDDAEYNVEEDPSLDYISLSLKDKHFLVVCLNFYSLYEDGEFRIKDFTDFEPTK